MKNFTQKIIQLILITFLVSLFLGATSVSAIDCPSGYTHFVESPSLGGFHQCIPPRTIGDPARLSDLETIFGNVVTVLLGLAGFALLAMIIVGGFRILFSAGDPKAIEAGRNTLTWAFTGFAMVIIAWFLLLLIEAATGVDITIFRIGPWPTPTPPPQVGPPIPCPGCL